MTTMNALGVGTYPAMTGGRSTLLTVDGIDLRTLVRDAELAQATADGQAALAGSYAGVWEGQVLTPGGPLWGVNEIGEETELLWCDCENSGCWDFVAQVHVTDDRVTWTGFRQVHRDWTYGELSSLTFDRRAYEAAIAHPQRLDEDPWVPFG